MSLTGGRNIFILHQDVTNCSARYEGAAEYKRPGLFRQGYHCGTALAAGKTPPTPHKINRNTCTDRKKAFHQQRKSNGQSAHSVASKSPCRASKKHVLCVDHLHGEIFRNAERDNIEGGKRASFVHITLRHKLSEGDNNGYRRRINRTFNPVCSQLPLVTEKSDFV